MTDTTSSLEDTMITTTTDNDSMTSTSMFGGYRFMAC